MTKRLFLTALLTFASTPAFAQASPTNEQVSAIIERLLRGMTGPDGDVQFTFGRIPAALPITLDPRFSVVGSVRMSANNGQYVQQRVLLSTTLPMEEARAVLQESLAGTDWKSRPDYGQPFGFISQNTVRNTGFYREGSINYIMDALMMERADHTDLDLNINVIPKQQVEQFKKGPRFIPQSSLPLLRAFPGAKVRVGMTPTFPIGAMSSAQVQTDSSANEVFAFYSAQLKAAGWQARTDTVDGPLRAVTYTLKDLNGREAVGVLGIRPWEKEGGGYVLSVSVQGFKP